MKKGRTMWLKGRAWTLEEKQENLNFIEGFYMFGGIDQNSNPSNDLYLI